MNLSKVQLLGEQEGHYELTDGKAPFRVPKKGLSEAMHEKIRCLAPKMAAGGAALSVDELSGATPEQIAAAMAGASTALPPESLSRPWAQSIPSEEPVPAIAAQPSLDAPPTEDPRLTQLKQLGKTALDNLANASHQDPFVQIRNDGTDKAMAEKAARPPSLRLKSDTPKAEPAPSQAAAPIAPPAPRGGGASSAPMPGIAEVQQGTEQERAALEVKGQLEADQARATAAALAEGDKILQQHELQQKELTVRAQATAADMMRKFDAAQNELRNIDTTVDPGRYWASRSTSGKIASIIGLALGALGAGPDGVNRAAMMLNQAIDRDIDAQKAEHTIRLQKGKAGVDAAQTMFGMSQQIFQSDLAADAAARSTAWARVDNSLKRIVAAGAGPQAQAAAALLSARALEEQGKFKSQAANIAYDNTTQRMLANATVAARSAPAGLPPKQAELVTEIEQRNQSIQASGQKLLALIDAYGTGEVVAPGVEAQMKQLANDIAVDAAKLKDPGSVARPNEVELELKNLFEPGWLQRSASAKAKINSFLQNTTTRRNGAYTVRGLAAPGGR